MQLTQEAVRRLLLHAQGLLQPPTTVATERSVLDAIRRMGVLQIDTISVVARSPYLVLWSRLGQYDPRWLHGLLAKGKLFEYWSHAACFLPIEAYPLYRGEMLDGHPHTRTWIEAHPEAVEHVRRFLHEQDEVRSVDFERTGGPAAGWWDWKPEKRALECLFSIGEVMIKRRDPNFHRVYALRERVVPGWDDAALPAPDMVRREFLLRAVRALGAPKAAWVPDYFRIPKRRIGEELDALVAEGMLLRAEVEGWNEPVYVHPGHQRATRKILSRRLTPEVTTLLSPFDPIVWDRARALQLFDFDYKIEVYTPEAKRRYGYFSLPILHRDALVGRLDAKAYRKEGRFVVRSLHLEPGVAVTADLMNSLSATLHACAAWHNAPEVTVERSNPPDVAGELNALIRVGGTQDH